MTEHASGLDRRALLDAILTHVPFDGWSQKALNAAAEDCGLAPGDMARAFPKGSVDVIEYFNTVADDAMVEAMAAESLESMRIRDRITLAVRTRLEQNAAHRDAIRRGLTLLSFPANAPIGMRYLYRTVDAAWRAAGDTATDFNFYTKRALMAGVYSSTLVYWLNDSSEGFAKTWAFLDRRIDNVMQVPKATQRIKDIVDRFPDPMDLKSRFRPPRRGL